MKKYTIPKENADLRKYAFWHNWWRPIAFVAYIAVLFAAFAFFVLGRHEDIEPLKWWVYPAFTAAVLVSGWFIFNVKRFFFDRNVSGVISEMSFERNFGRGLNRSAGVTIDDHTYVRMTVKTDTGKRKRIRATLFDDGYDGYYAEGREIIKFRGFNYPVCIESEKNGSHLCVVCGVRTFYKQGKMIHGEAEPARLGDLIICRSCGHTLLKIEEETETER